MSTTTSNRTDIYTRVTNQIVEQLEQGVRPWLQPWNAEHAAGRITKAAASQRRELSRHQHYRLVDDG